MTAADEQLESGKRVFKTMKVCGEDDIVVAALSVLIGAVATVTGSDEVRFNEIIGLLIEAAEQREHMADWETKSAMAKLEARLRSARGKVVA